MARRKMAVAFLGIVLATVWIAKAGWILAAYRYLHGPEQVVEVHFPGMVCGAHFRGEVRTIHAARGSRIRFVNASPYWPVSVQLSPAGIEGRKGPVVSPPLHPGESWTYTSWREGRFFVASVQPLERWAAWQGWLHVDR